jgi:hypothetical protein
MTPKVNEMAQARRLRACYQFARRNTEMLLRDRSYRVPACLDLDRVPGPEATRDSVWQKLERSCRRRQIPPVPYIHWRLSIDQVRLSRPPEPNQLLDPRRLEAYRASQPRERRKLAVRLLVQDNTARRHFIYYRAGGLMSPEDAWACVLADRMLELTPLFRFTWARIVGTPRLDTLARLFEAEAMVQYYCQQGLYDAVWGKLLPADLASRAPVIYDQILEHQR